MGSGPGRNDPCPCGSKKKFKHCCDRKRQTNGPRDASLVPHSVLPRIKADRVDFLLHSSAIYKIFQVLLGRDGSIYVNLPYFQLGTGILSVVSMRPNASNSYDIDLKEGGKIASHLVKYSHHPNGKAHFSQTGRVASIIGRQACPLEDQDGHLFTIIFKDLGAFKTMNGPIHKSTYEHAFAHIKGPGLEDSDEFKIVGYWTKLPRLLFSPREESINIVHPYREFTHALRITCVRSALPGQNGPTLMFLGGFDGAKIVNDLSQETGFIAFNYPIENAESLKKLLGSADWNPPPKDDSGPPPSRG